MYFTALPRPLVADWTHSKPLLFQNASRGAQKSKAREDRKRAANRERQWQQRHGFSRTDHDSGLREVDCLGAKECWIPSQTVRNVGDGSGNVQAGAVPSHRTGLGSHGSSTSVHRSQSCSLRASPTAPGIASTLSGRAPQRHPPPEPFSHSEPEDHTSAPLSPPRTTPSATLPTIVNSRRLPARLIEGVLHSPTHRTTASPYLLYQKPPPGKKARLIALILIESCR